jgi:hypothetical protein
LSSGQVFLAHPAPEARDEAVAVGGCLARFFLFVDRGGYVMDDLSSFAGWAIMALLVMGVTSVVCLTLIIQMLLTGRMGLRRRVNPADVDTENPHGFERPL